MFKIQFTPRGQREFKKLSFQIQKRISQKLSDNARLENPLIRAKLLISLPPATHRYRIGKHRVSFFAKKGTIFVERVETRNKAYRR